MAGREIKKEKSPAISERTDIEDGQVSGIRVARVTIASAAEDDVG
jgi:hypothetical protein